MRGMHLSVWAAYGERGASRPRSPFHGKLIRLTTTVEERGQVSETTSANASSDIAGRCQSKRFRAKADSERDSKPSLGLPVPGAAF
jgi:hypothetical protein